MLGRYAQQNILSDLRKELLIYRIFILFPFEILRNQQLVTTWRVRLYMLTMLLVYAILRLSFLLEDFDSTVQFFIIRGKIWMFIILFDFVFSAISFVGIFANGLIMNIHQIEFYQELHNFDIMLQAMFGILVKRSRVRRVNSYVLIASLAYNIFAYLLIFINYGAMELNSYKQFAYLFTYFFFNNISKLSAHMFISCAQLCRERLEIVKKLLRNHSRCSSVTIETVLQLYTRICKLILLINNFLGFVVLLKVIRDYTLGSAIMYLMCTSFGKARIYEISSTLWMFSQAIIGTLAMSYIADKLVTEANECTDIVSGLNNDEMYVSKQILVDNFLLRIRHRSPALDVFGLFQMDLQMIFAMGCGMVSYLFVLLQFQEFQNPI